MVPIGAAAVSEHAVAVPAAVPSITGRGPGAMEVALALSRAAFPGGVVRVVRPQGGDFLDHNRGTWAGSR
jgi:hypothetical protein